MFRWDESLLPVSNILRNVILAHTGGSKKNLTQVLQRSTILK